MADISKITPPGSQTTYNLKDATAREQALIVAENGGGINKLNPIPMFTSGQYAAYNATTNTYGETAGHLDTYSNLRFMIQACTGTTASDFTVVSTLVNSNITQNGTPAWLFTKLSTFNRLYVGHNGSQTDCKFFFDVSNLEDNQKYYLCVNITNYTHANNEPFTWKNVMVLSEEDYLSGLWQVYQPYALPNSALTQGVIWNTNNGVKNFATENSFSNTGYYKDVPVDGSLTGEIEVYIGNITSTDTDSSKCAILYIYSDGTSSPSYLVDRGTSTTLYGNLESNVLKSIRIYPSDNYVHSSGDTVTVTNLMVCPKFLYDADPTYEPYSLPNTKITPVLIECVDSGAKNLINSTSGSGTRWVNIIFSEAIPAGNYVVGFSTITSADNTSGTVQVNLMSGETNVGSPSYNAITLSKSPLAVAITATSSFDRIRLYADNNSEASINKVVSYTTAFLCEKSLWDVSQKIVPYRMSNTELTNNILIENVTSHFTAKTGFTIQTGYTKIFKQGMHIFGKMVVKKDSGTFNNNTQEQIVETDYQMNSQYFSCAFADDLYRCNNIGYCFMGVSGSKAAFTVRDTVTGSNNYVVLSIDFIVQ